MTIRPRRLTKEILRGKTIMNRTGVGNISWEHFKPPTFVQVKSSQNHHLGTDPRVLVTNAGYVQRKQHLLN